MVMNMVLMMALIMAFILREAKLKISGIGGGIAEEVFRRRQGLMTQVTADF
jgi:hypothetical protein